MWQRSLTGVSQSESQLSAKQAAVWYKSSVTCQCVSALSARNTDGAGSLQAVQVGGVSQVAPGRRRLAALKLSESMFLPVLNTNYVFC